MKRQSIAILAAIVLVLVLVPLVFSQGATNFSGLVVDGNSATATPAFVADQDGAGAIAEFRDAATPVFQVANGGNADFNGNQVDLDADNDTSITADTDDQIDVEISGSDEFVFTADELDVTNGQLVNIGAAGTDFSTSGGLTLAAGLTVSDGDVVVADDLRTTAQTSITVTNAAAFTPTGTYQPITAAGEVTPTITAGATAGDLLVLINTSAQAVNIADSGTAKLTAAAVLNQFDTLTLWSDGTNWIEISRTDN